MKKVLLVFALFNIAGASYFQQIPLVDEPDFTIDIFTRSVSHSTFGDEYDTFAELWGVCKIRHSRFGEMTFAVDPWWHRIAYGAEGMRGLKGAGSSRLYCPWDIVAYGYYVFVTDEVRGVVARFRIEEDHEHYPELVFDRYIGGTVGGQPHIKWPRGIAYNDKGTSSLVDDQILVCDISDSARCVWIINALSGQFEGRIASVPSVGRKLTLPLDVAVSKVNNNDVFIINRGLQQIVWTKLDNPDFWFALPFAFEDQLYSLDTDWCGRVLVSTKRDVVYVLEFLDIGGGQIIVDTLDVFPGPPFNKIHDIYVSGNEVIVSERWTDNSGISLYRITQECAPECCKPVVDITWPRRDGQLIIADSVPIRGLAKCKGIGAGCEGYDYLKYWALYIAEGWNPLPEDFAPLAGAPGATDDEDTLCWLRADTFEPGNYTLLLRGVSNDPVELGWRPQPRPPLARNLGNPEIRSGCEKHYSLIWPAGGVYSMTLAKGG